MPEVPEHHLHSRDLDEALADAELAVIVTAHSGLGLAVVVDTVSLVIDLRGVTRHLPSTNVVRL